MILMSPYFTVRAAATFSASSGFAPDARGAGADPVGGLPEPIAGA
jgi:hypothetical protein